MQKTTQGLQQGKAEWQAPAIQEYDATREIKADLQVEGGDTLLLATS